MKNKLPLVLLLTLPITSFANDLIVGDATKASQCSNHYRGRISEPRIKPPLNISVSTSSVVRLETIGSQEDTLEIVTSSDRLAGNRQIGLNLGQNIVDFVVTGEGEVHSWHAAIKVDDIAVFEHQQSKLPAYSCGDEMYRYRLIFTVTADQRFVIATSVNLRDRPTTDANIVGKLPISTQVAIQPSGRYDEWVRVMVQGGEHDGQSGWLPRDFLADKRPTIEWLRKEYDRSSNSDVSARQMWSERITALEQASVRPVQIDRDSRLKQLTEKMGLTSQSPIKIEWSKTYSLVGDDEIQSDFRFVPYHVAEVGNGFLIGRGPNAPFGAAWALVKLDHQGNLKWEKRYPYREIHTFIPHKSGFVAYGHCYTRCLGTQGGRFANNGRQPWIMYANHQGEPIMNYFDWPLGGVFPLLMSQGEVLTVYEKVWLCERKVCYTANSVPSSNMTSMKFDTGSIGADTVNNFFTLPIYKAGNEAALHSVDVFELVSTAQGFIHIGAYVLFGNDGAYRSEQSHFVATSDRSGKLLWIKHLGVLSKAIEINGEVFLIGASKGVRIVRISYDGNLISDNIFPAGKRLIQITDAVAHTNGFFVSGVRLDRRCEGADSCGDRQNEEDFIMRFSSEGRLLWEQTFRNGERVVKRMLAVDDGLMLFSDSTLRVTRVSIR